MYGLALQLARFLDGARGRRDYRPFPIWHGYIDGIRHGFVRLFRLPLAELDHAGLPSQPWVWGAELRLVEDMLYVEGAMHAPPLAGLRPLLLEARAIGAAQLSLDRLKNGRIFTRVYDLDRILGPKTQDVRRECEALESSKLEVRSCGTGLGAYNCWD